MLHATLLPSPISVKTIIISTVNDMGKACRRGCIVEAPGTPNIWSFMNGREAGAHWP